MSTFRSSVPVPAGNSVAWSLTAVQAPHLFGGDWDMPTLVCAAGNDESLRLTIEPREIEHGPAAILAAARAVLQRLGPAHARITLALLAYWVQRGPSPDGFCHLDVTELFDLFDRKRRHAEDRQAVIQILRDLDSFVSSVHVRRKLGKREIKEHTDSRLFDVAFTARDQEGSPYRFHYRPGYWATIALKEDARYVVDVPVALLRLHGLHDAMAVQLGCYLALRARSRHGHYVYAMSTLVDGAGLEPWPHKGRFRRAAEQALAALTEHGVVASAQCLDPLPSEATDARTWWDRWLAARWEITPAPDIARALAATEKRYRDHRERARRRSPRKVV